VVKVVRQDVAAREVACPFPLGMQQQQTFAQPMMTTMAAPQVVVEQFAAGTTMMAAPTTMFAAPTMMAAPTMVMEQFAAPTTTYGFP